MSDKKKCRFHLSKNKVTVYLVFLLLLHFNFNAIAFDGKYSRKIQWCNNQSISMPNNETIDYLYFDGAIYKTESKNLPVYYERFNLPDMGEFINIKSDVKLTNKVFKEFEYDEIKNIKDLDLINEHIKVNSSVIYDKKKPFVSISFVPVRKNQTSNKYEKLISFDIELNITYIPTDKSRYNKHTYAQNSVLATGNWYKISVSNTGIYKITRNELSNMGIDVSSIDPRNIRIYGNGQGMLPESNSKFRYDDLQENAIFVEGENDASFDGNDYVLFYGESPDKWIYDTIDMNFHHSIHKYSDVNCYFIITDLGQGKRIELESSVSLPANKFINKFQDYAFHEKESVNLLKSGKKWYGEAFDILTSYGFSFTFPNIDVNSKVYLKTDIIARSNLNSTFNVTANGNNMVVIVPSVNLDNYTGSYAKSSSDTTSFNTSGSTININITYNKPNTNSLGWLNYIEINAARNLIFSDGQMCFRNTESVGQDNISEFTLSNSSLSLNIWDITDPIEIKKIDASLSGNNLIFKLHTDSLKEFIAYDGSYFYTPNFLYKIENQNLHALDQYDMLVVSHPNFINEANQLAELHRNNDGLSVVIVTPQQIYNEFSSGIQDVTAIRDFVKMFYDRAGTDIDKMPEYLLLFGDGSYDNKNRITNNTNFIPTYQSENSLIVTASYVTDDYFGLLDDNEGSNANGNLDIGIGRLPVKTTAQAKDIVNKIIRYTSKSNLACQNTACSSVYANSISNYADWRNIVCFIADDEDSNSHINQSDALATLVDTIYKDYNVDKIYLDAYQQLSTPGGQRYPEVNDAINKRVEKGALLINYTGHGGEVGWTHERVLEVSDINGWKNLNNMPVFFTATCEFSRFDDPERTSAGEYVVLNQNGGGAALFTTTRIAFSGSNYAINKSFYNYVFKKIGDKFPCLGDIIKLSKIENASVPNLRNFVLLGDPAMQLAYPKYDVNTISINNCSLKTNYDTIKALSKVAVSGYVQDNIGNKLTDFNGVIYPTVFDKTSVITTLANDPASNPKNFYLQKNILFKGKVSVINGDFLFTFVVPKDIAYNYGIGKISYYAVNDDITNISDANGYYENIIIGGSNDSIEPDDIAPNIKLYLNDTNFMCGGITDEHPLLLAFVSDCNGINTVGNGIGHDITAILDNNNKGSVVLNDYYESDLDDYKKGVIRYPFSDLSEGKHTLTLKVWDVYNNSSQAYTEFVVVKSNEVVLKNMFNYPNPFTTTTCFRFEHNQACSDLNVQIKIFSITGKLVKTINKTISTSGFIAESVSWDGKNDFGSKVSKGIYIYKLQVNLNTGEHAEATGKLIILK